MEQLTATMCGAYMYGVIAADQAVAEAELSGIEAGEVYYVVEGALAAVVSDVPNGTLPPQRRHLAAHQRVLTHLMGKSGLLPMSFGIIAEDIWKVHQILSSNQDVLLDQLRRVTGKVQMGLRVRWNAPDVFDYFVDTHTQLAVLRDRFSRGGREPCQGDKIELGRLFDGILNTDRAAHSATVRRILLPHCVEIWENETREDRDIMHLACLVARGRQKEFENAILDAARLFDDTFSFDSNGPWPPYDFVDVELSI